MALVGVELETLVSEPDALRRIRHRTQSLTALLVCIPLSEWCVFIQDFRTSLYSRSKIHYLWYIARYQIKHIISILARVTKPIILFIVLYSIIVASDSF